MSTLVERSTAQSRPRSLLGKSTLVQGPAPATVGRNGSLPPALDLLVGVLMSMACLTAQFAGYMIAVLSIPVMPFVAPLGLGSVLLAFGLVIIGAGMLAGHTWLL